MGHGLRPDVGFLADAVLGGIHADLSEKRQLRRRAEALAAKRKLWPHGSLGQKVCGIGRFRLFPDLLDGAEYQADILVKARFRDQNAYFLIHVEHQSDAPATFHGRFFRYFSAIFEKHDAPNKPQPGMYQIDFPDGEVLRFRYRVVQLNRLPWPSARGSL